MGVYVYMYFIMSAANWVLAHPQRYSER
jgi:hypothetical protein